MCKSEVELIKLNEELKSLGLELVKSVIQLDCDVDNGLESDTHCYEQIEIIQRIVEIGKIFYPKHIE